MAFENGPKVDVSADTRAAFHAQAKNDPVLFACLMLWQSGEMPFPEAATRAAVELSKQNRLLMDLIVRHGIPPSPEWVSRHGVPDWWQKLPDKA